MLKNTKFSLINIVFWPHPSKLKVFSKELLKSLRGGGAHRIDCFCKDDKEVNLFRIPNDLNDSNILVWEFPEFCFDNFSCKEIFKLTKKIVEHGKLQVFILTQNYFIPKYFQILKEKEELKQIKFCTFYNNDLICEDNFYDFNQHPFLDIFKELYILEWKD